MDTDMGEHELVVGQFAEIAQLPLDQAREIVASQNYNLEEALNFFYAIGPPPEPVQLPPQNFDDLPPSPYRYVNEDTPPGELHRTAGGMHTQHPEDFAVREAPASGSDSVRALLEHARATPADQVPAVPGSSSFASGGRALGSAGVSGGSSRQDAHPNAPIFDDPPIQRTLKFWKDNSFSIDDGERLDLDDPANVAILNQIKNGSRDSPNQRNYFAVMKLAPNSFVVWSEPCQDSCVIWRSPGERLRCGWLRKLPPTSLRRSERLSAQVWRSVQIPAQAQTALSWQYRRQSGVARFSWTCRSQRRSSRFDLRTAAS
eukprot:c8290_g1_i2.p1 GENE.c8290_g1_i2~~c8290_g1_i2.p1  ORF type:complete len:316 (-),score=30.70 c8290_g1_i2:210-1157(-)